MYKKPLSVITVRDVFGDYYKIEYYRKIDMYELIRKAYALEESLKDTGVLVYSVQIDTDGKSLEV